jgi:hypothetical protein
MLYIKRINQVPKLFFNNNNKFYYYFFYSDDIVSSWNPRKEVNEMEVMITGTPSNPVQPANPEIFAFREAANTAGRVSVGQTNQASIVQEIHDKVLMDLEDVQKFLYMLIGSQIRVESGENSVGKRINTVA